MSHRFQPHRSRSAYLSSCFNLHLRLINQTPGGEFGFIGERYYTGERSCGSNAQLLALDRDGSEQAEQEGS